MFAFINKSEVKRAKYELSDFKTWFNSLSIDRVSLPNEDQKAIFDKIESEVNLADAETKDASSIWTKLDVCKAIVPILFNPERLTSYSSTFIDKLSSGKYLSNLRQNDRVLWNFQYIKIEAETLIEKDLDEILNKNKLRFLQEHTRDCIFSLNSNMHKDFYRCRYKSSLVSIFLLCMLVIIVPFTIVNHYIFDIKYYYLICGFAGALIARGRLEAESGISMRVMWERVGVHIIYLMIGGFLGLISIAAIRSNLIIGTVKSALDNNTIYLEYIISVFSGFAPLFILKLIEKKLDE